MPRKPKRIAALEALAREMVGDGKSGRPNVYFVSDRGNVVTVTRSFQLAYKQFRSMAQRSPRVECALEDRIVGTLATVERDGDEYDGRLVIRDDTHMLSRKARNA